jgi:methylase of polypeptide subunit release factors
MSELTEAIMEKLPEDLPYKIQDPDYNEETAAKNYGVQVLQILGLENANYEEWINEDDRPDFIWDDKNGITRIVGEFKAPWDEDESHDDERYKLQEGIDQCIGYNDSLKLKYIFVTDGRWIHLRDVYSSTNKEWEIDLLDIFHEPERDEVERDALKLQEQLTNIYGGVWNDEPSQRDISVNHIFEEFIESSNLALNQDLLPSIEEEFDRYNSRFEEYTTKKQDLEDKRENVYERNLDYREPDIYKEAIKQAYKDPFFDYQEHFEDPPKDVDSEKLINQVEELVNELRAIRSEVNELEYEYRLARNWSEKWQHWLDLRGVDYEEATSSEQDDLEATFQLQTLNLLYNRLLIIRIFEDLGIIGQLISDGFIKIFDAKVKLRRGNRYTEPLESASKQAREVYNPLFERNTPHDWYHYEEDVLKTVLRRFDNYNFRNIDRDIFGEMYQKCLDDDKRKRLGAFYTPPEVVNFLFDFTGYTKENRKLRARNKSVIDPACGSGTFLLEYLKRYLKAEKEAGRDLNDALMIQKVVRNVNQKLTGFDIDPFAVQLAQSNLLIHLIREKRNSEEENGGITTETDDHLDLPKFPVYETDSLLTINDESLNPDRFYRAHETDPEHLDEINRAKQDEYGFVMGNPPYIRYHNQEGITAKYQQLHNQFQSESDIYVGFVEQALKWLEEGGQMAFVISDRILVNRPSQRIRQYILDNAKIDLVVDLTRSKIFGFDVNVFPLLIVLTKEADEDDRMKNEIDVAKVFMKGSWEQPTWAHALGYVASELMDADEPDYDFENNFSPEKEEYEDTENDDAYKTYTVSQSRFVEKQSDWSNEQVLNVQIEDDLWDVVLEMEDPNDCVALEDITQLNDEGRIVTRGGGASAINSYRVNKSNPSGAPVLTGGDIDEFILEYNGEYDDYVDYNRLEKDFEEDDRELEMSENKADVIINEEIIAWRYTASTLSFVVDGPGGKRRFLKRRIYFLRLKESDGFDEFSDRSNLFNHHYIAGLLNSDLLDFYYKAYYEHKAFRHAPEIDAPAEYLQHLPIYIPSDNEQKRIVGYSIDLHELHKELHKTKNQQENLFSHYEVDDDLIPFRDYIQATVKEHDTYALKSLNTELDGETLELNRYFVVELYDEDKAEKLKRFMEKFKDIFDEGRVVGGDLDELRLPSSLDKFIDEYDDLSEEIDCLEEEIKSTREDLNEAVFDMYGVDKDDRESIQKYLKDFLTVIE